jgi:hypothetical protein
MVFIPQMPKTQRTPRGTLTAFCPVCRLPTQLKVATIQEEVPAHEGDHGSGQARVDEATCPVCRTVYGAAPNSITVNAFPDTNLESAMGMLSEPSAAAIAERMAIEQRVLENRLTPEERAGLIAEPFAMLGYYFTRPLPADRGMLAFVIATVSAAFCVIAATVLWVNPKGSGAAAYTPGQPLSKELIGATALALILSSASVFLWIRRKQHRVRATTARLVKSLAPLKPTIAELEHAMHMTSQGHSSAAAVKVNPAEIVRRTG